MSNERNADKNGSKNLNTGQKTIVPGKTVNNAPDPGATMIGGADTVEDAKGLEATIDPSSKTVNANAKQESESDQASIHTFISSPDSAATEVREISDEVGAHPTLDMDTATPDQTLIVEMDGVGETFIGQADQSAGREDLEDHFDTLIEDAHSPGTSPSDPGGFVIGDYQVLKELGRGGMGVVYKARHRKLNREVALKMILAGPHAGNEALERFITEARAVAHLQHPGIVQIFDIGEHEGLPFFSLEFVDGCDLQQKLAGKPQDAKESATLVEKLCHAMHYAHENNILHRDIKPPNVLLDQNGEPKITDFGLAKQVDTEEGSTATQAGTIMGSPSYMPPEQARGDVSSVTPRSDLYSLGAVLYEMLTGRPPFLAKRALETVMQVVHNEPVAPRQLMPEIPIDLETICLKSLQKDQAARYQSCAELAADLRRFINDEPILARPIGKAERLWKWCKRNPKIALPSGLAMTAVAMTAVIATWAWQATSAQAAIITQEKENVEEQRDEAEKQRLIATEAREKAEENEETARKQSLVALKSIQFVLTEIDRELQPRPQLSEVRLSLMNALSKKWDDIDVELAGGEQGEAAATLMAVRKKIADIYAELDELKKADEEYSKLYEAGKKRVLVKQGTDSSRYNLAQIILGWAPIRKRALNDPGEALRLQEEAVEVMKDMVENPKPEPGSPGPIQIQTVASQIIQNVGVEYLHNGMVKETVKKWEEALTINKRIQAAIPEAKEFNDSEAQRTAYLVHIAGEVDRGHVALGYVELRLGNTEGALQLYEKGIEGSRTKLLARPDDIQAKASLGGYLNLLGRAYLWLENARDAEPALLEGERYIRDAYDSDPSVARVARSYASCQYDLAVLADLQSDLKKAVDAATISRNVTAALVEKSPDRKNKIRLMLVEARLGNADVARPIIDELGETDKPDTEAHLDRSRALAQLSVRAEADLDRQAYVGAALTALERCINDGYSDPFRISHENDLAPLREEPRFRDIVAQLSNGR